MRIWTGRVRKGEGTMKRSELIEVLVETLQTNHSTNVYTNGSTPLTVVLTVLKAAEKAGMAPPFTELFENNNGDKIVKQARVWEPEDLSGDGSYD